MEEKKKGSSVLGGLLILVIGVTLLWYNEGRAVKTAQGIGEAKDNYVDVSSKKIEKKNENKLIATVGDIKLPETEVLDEEFGISVKSAKLARTVEMYQWKEDCDSDNNCSYEKVWDDDIIISAFFEDTTKSNPENMPYESKKFTNTGVYLGAYELTEDLLDQLSTSKPVTELNQTIAANLGLEIAKVEKDSVAYTNVKNNTPEIGNIRIKFYYNDATKASVMGIQSGKSINPFITKTDTKIYRLEEGNHTGLELLKMETQDNNLLKWILRFFGTVLVIAGLGAMVAPLQKIASFIPIFGNIFNWITGKLIFGLGFSISLIVIAIAWFKYRPLMSLMIFVGVIATIVLLKILSKKKKLKANENITNEALNNSSANNQITNQTSEQSLISGMNQVPNQMMGQAPMSGMNQVPNQMMGQASMPGMEQVPNQMMGQAPMSGMNQVPNQMMGQASMSGMNQVPNQMMGQASMPGMNQVPNQMMGQAPIPGMNQVPNQMMGQASMSGMNQVPNQMMGQTPMTGMNQVPNQMMGQAPMPGMNQVPNQIPGQVPMIETNQNNNFH